MSDNSTPTNQLAFLNVLNADQLAFVNALEGAAPGPAMLRLAAVVKDSPTVMPVTTAYLLGFEAGATFAQGVARIRANLAAGRAPL